MSKKLGQLVKEARSAAGLTQTALAQKVDGLSAADIGKIERGESEPTQAILRQMAKVLGVTQKSLLDAAAGASKKTSSSKTSSGKTASGKTSTAKTSSSRSSSLTLTAAEKKLVEKYRKADAATKKAAMNVLSGDGNILEIAAALMASAGKTGSSGSSSGSGVNAIVTDLIGSLLSGKTGSRSAAPVDPDALQALQALLRQQGQQ